MQAAPAGDGFKVPGAGGTSTTTQVPGTGATGATGGSTQQTQGTPGGLGPIMLPLLLVFVFMILMTSMSGRKEKKRREAMLSSIKRGDRVQTTGGIIGTIVDLDSSEMTLRVDESSNTRIRFSRGAIQGVVREGRDGGRAEMEAKPASQSSTVA